MKAKLIFNTILFLALAFTGCEKSGLKCADDPEFCALIGKEEYTKTGPIIDKYLSGLDKNLSAEDKLNLLSDWLTCKSCVSGAEILCNSCIYTLPAQSELRIWFSVNGKTTEKTLDILMADPLRFSGFHN